MADFLKVKKALAWGIVLAALIALVLATVSVVVSGTGGGYPVWFDAFGILVFYGPGVGLALLFGFGLRSGRNWAEILTAFLAVPAALAGFFVMALMHFKEPASIAPIWTWWGLDQGWANLAVMWSLTILVGTLVVAFFTAVAALIYRSRTHARPIQSHGPPATA